MGGDHGYLYGYLHALAESSVGCLDQVWVLVLGLAAEADVASFFFELCDEGGWKSLACRAYKCELDACPFEDFEGSFGGEAGCGGYYCIV